jgi:leader peptidase (prepilin peptidase)/N-methyltransferase
MNAVVPAMLLLAMGLVVGSFLNVCIYRLPRNESVAWPGSHCTTCDRELSWFENIPVLSWVVLGGRCRTCRKPISMRYPIVEAITGVLFVIAYFVFGLTLLLVVRLLFTCAMIVLFAIDLEHQILPNEITLPGIVVGFALSFFVPPIAPGNLAGWQSSLIALLVGGLFPFLIAEAYARIRGKEGMGMGDFKMLAMVGAFLGWPIVWLTIILSCALGIVIGGGALLVSRRGFGTRIAFGTFIAVAALICAYAEVPVLRVYDQALRAYLTWAGLA